MTDLNGTLNIEFNAATITIPIYNFAKTLIPTLNDTDDVTIWCQIFVNNSYDKFVELITSFNVASYTYTIQDIVTSIGIVLVIGNQYKGIGVLPAIDLQSAPTTGLYYAYNQDSGVNYVKYDPDAKQDEDYNLLNTIDVDGNITTEADPDNIFDKTTPKNAYIIFANQYSPKLALVNSKNMYRYQTRANSLLGDGTLYLLINDKWYLDVIQAMQYNYVYQNPSPRNIIYTDIINKYDRIMSNYSNLKNKYNNAIDNYPNYTSNKFPVSIWLYLVLFVIFVIIFSIVGSIILIRFYLDLKH